jgi:hypothetical protein
MIKVLLPILNLLILLVIQIFPGNISVSMQAPNEVTAGTEFEVKLTFEKPGVEGFSRFQQNIPPGLEAVAATSANADFSFTDNRLRLIWLRMPQQNEITVTYKIKIDQRLKGTFTLGGKFSYIENNERKSIDVTPVAVNILPSPTIDPSLIVDISEFEKRYIPHISPVSAESGNMVCIRQKPYQGASANEYIVKLLVNKEDKKKFAKVEETVPEGYMAVALDTKDAIFTFKNQTAKFLWMNLPAEPYFTISYRLIPKNQVKLQPPQLKGLFSFMVEDKTVSLPIVEKDVDLLALRDYEIKNLIVEVKSQPADLAAQAEPIKVSEFTKEEKQAKTPEKVKIPKGKTSISYVLEPESGVYYRVQVAAGHRAVDVERYFRKFNLGKEVRKEIHEGWHKYSVGSFKVYKEARDYRVHIWNTTPVKDAFVAAYNSGKRITVQEALMITEQQWYR